MELLVNSREDRAWRDYSEGFRKHTLPNLLSSSIFLSIHSDNPDFDGKQATEVGAALLLGKPLLLVVPRGRSLPDGLRRAAAEVIEDWDADDVNCQERLTSAIRRMTTAGGD
jgi:hypothetical protein